MSNKTNSGATTEKTIKPTATPKKAAPEKQIFKAFKQTGPVHKEYELLSPSGIIFMMKAGPIPVYDVTSDSVKNIRYIPQENSIFVSEQSKTSKPVKSPIIFEKGRLWVSRKKPNLTRFLDAHPGNEANGGNMFRMVDLTKDAKVDMNNEYAVVDALVALREKPLQDLLAVATAFGINTDRTVDEIKHDLMLFAKKSPSSFIQAFDNPMIEAKAKVRKAMSDGIVHFAGGHIKWTDTNKHIIAVPVGQEPADVFARFCMTEAGAAVLGEIERQL